MEKTNNFLFLYPRDPYFNVELDNGGLLYLTKKGLLKDYPDLMKKLGEIKDTEKQKAIKKEWSERDKLLFRKEYQKLINSCINFRYRNNGFIINWAVFDDCEVSDMIYRNAKDNIIKVGLSFKQHTTKDENGSNPYPDSDFILDKINYLGISHLRIAGFHMWDCVDMVARRAHGRGVDVLVDEDLTEFLASRAISDDFVIDKYPGYNPKKHFTGTGGFDGFMEPRLERPWLLQKY